MSFLKITILSITILALAITESETEKNEKDAQGLNVVRGRPIRASVIVDRVKKILGI